MKQTAVTTTASANPNSPYWQQASADSARTLSRLMPWSEYDAFFAALEGQSHQQIAQACNAKIAELRRASTNRPESVTLHIAIARLPETA